MFRDNYSFTMEDYEMIERYDAAQKCLLGMGKVTDDLGALIQAYAELSQSIGNRVRKEIADREKNRLSCDISGWQYFRRSTSGLYELRRG